MHRPKQSKIHFDLKNPTKKSLYHFFSFSQRTKLTLALSPLKTNQQLSVLV